MPFSCFVGDCSNDDSMGTGGNDDIMSANSDADYDSDDCEYIQVNFEIVLFVAKLTDIFFSLLFHLQQALKLKASMKMMLLMATLLMMMLCHLRTRMHTTLLHLKVTNL